MNHAILEQVLLSALLVVPAFALVFKPRLFPRVPVSILFLTCSIVVYVMFLLYVQVTEARLEAELASFDLDGDGIFSGVEITREQDAAMHRVVADTARTFAPITGVGVAPACVAMAFLIVKVVRRVGSFSRRILPGRA